jgi:hypothetical protein
VDGERGMLRLFFHPGSVGIRCIFFDRKDQKESVEYNQNGNFPPRAQRSISEMTRAILIVSGWLLY